MCLHVFKVPLVDAPIAALQSSSLLAEDGQGYVCVGNHWGKLMEAALWRNRDTTAMSIKVYAVSSLVSRLAIVWGR